MNELHKIQREILIKLLFSQGLRFSDLKIEPDMENSQLVFHLDVLKDLGYIEKDATTYRLTPIGKEFANRHDSDTKGFKKQAKISVWVAARRNNDEFLIGTRQKNPFFGSQGFISGKLDFGETIYKGARREMKEETNLEGEPTLIHIRHYINRDKTTEEVIEDKFLYLFIVDNPTGELNQSEEAIFEWVHRNNFQEKITKSYESYEGFISDIKLIEEYDGHITFAEREQYPENF